MIRETYTDPKAANPPNFTIKEELQKQKERARQREIEEEESKEARREAERINKEGKRRAANKKRSQETQRLLKEAGFEPISEEVQRERLYKISRQIS